MADLGRPPPTSTVARAGGVAQFGRDQGEREFSFSSADFESCFVECTRCIAF